MLRPVLLAVLGLALTGPPALAQRCSRLHGHDLAPASDVRLVERSNGQHGTDLLGCILPREPVRAIASSAEYETSGDSYRLRQVAGSVLLLATTSSSQYGSSGRTAVYDIRRPRRAYAIATQCYAILLGYCPSSGPEDSLARALVNRAGQAVAALASDAGETTTIAGFSSSGARVTLDAGPAADLPARSLRLRAATAAWTHAGEPRSAELP
jgi:hypothetical protein